MLLFLHAVVLFLFLFPWISESCCITIYSAKCYCFLLDIWIVIYYLFIWIIHSYCNDIYQLGKFFIAVVVVNTSCVNFYFYLRISQSCSKGTICCGNIYWLNINIDKYTHTHTYVYTYINSNKYTLTDTETYTQTYIRHAKTKTHMNSHSHTL